MLALQVTMCAGTAGLNKAINFPIDNNLPPTLSVAKYEHLLHKLPLIDPQCLSELWPVAIVPGRSLPVVVS